MSGAGGAARAVSCDSRCDGWMRHFCWPEEYQQAWATYTNDSAGRWRCCRGVQTAGGALSGVLQCRMDAYACRGAATGTCAPAEKTAETVNAGRGQPASLRPLLNPLVPHNRPHQQQPACRNLGGRQPPPFSERRGGALAGVGTLPLAALRGAEAVRTPLPTAAASQQLCQHVARMVAAAAADPAAGAANGAVS